MIRLLAGVVGESGTADLRLLVYQVIVLQATALFARSARFRLVIQNTIVHAVEGDAL